VIRDACDVFCVFGISDCVEIMCRNQQKSQDSVQNSVGSEIIFV
jgi:hypothetical protein